MIIAHLHARGGDAPEALFKVDLIPGSKADFTRAGHGKHQQLKAKLYELELRKRQDAAQAVNDEKSDIAWGHQIRSYVLQPYQMVKDLRTGVETSQTGAVLDGEIDLFLEASLAAQLGGDEAD